MKINFSKIVTVVLYQQVNVRHTMCNELVFHFEFHICIVIWTGRDNTGMTTLDAMPSIGNITWSVLVSIFNVFSSSGGSGVLLRGVTFSPQGSLTGCCVTASLSTCTA